MKMLKVDLSGMLVKRESTLRLAMQEIKILGNTFTVWAYKYLKSIIFGHLSFYIYPIYNFKYSVLQNTWSKLLNN